MPFSSIELMQSHRSIRQFTDQAIAPKDLEQILLAGQGASTSSFLQPSSVIRITDRVKRERLVTLTKNQQYVADAPEFLVFCADLQRHHQIVPDSQLGFTELTLISAVDTAMMGQNALLAAESLGLGGVFIGSIRSFPDEVCELLALPHYVFPLFGLCLGYPAEDPEVKPRMPLTMLLHENSYQPLDKSQLAEYDYHVREYYKQRTHNSKAVSWSDMLAAKLAKEARPFMAECLHKQGLATK